jgi:type IV secretory pathway TraG/TraD family ATPase VirD4
MTIPTGGPSQPVGRDRARISVLEGSTILPTPQVAGAIDGRQPIRASLPGRAGTLRFDDTLLSKHVLCLGTIGCGKTTAMKQLLWQLRASASPDDVFVIFDSKGDFRDSVYRPGDAVITNDLSYSTGAVIWNLFADLLEQDPRERQDQIHEIAATVFSEGLERAGQNTFFAAGACDVFAAVVEAMAQENAAYSNDELRKRLEEPADSLSELLEGHPDLAGVARYLYDQQTAGSILAFLQQTLNKSFSGIFRTRGDFSMREFIRRKSGRAVFIEYDIAVGSRLLPIYRVLMDLAIKEALALGRRQTRPAGSVYFILDEFALLPSLSHIGDGVNFGRSLGLKFIVATQNVGQILNAYGHDEGQSILSGFGTVFAFRLMDNASRELVRQRHGGNRKRVTTFAAVRSEGVQQGWVDGHVIEDWDVADLAPGQCVVSLPAGPPIFFAFPEVGGQRPG